MTLQEWLSAEPFTLVLSSGFFGFYPHTGLMLALEEAGVTPARFAGASAGALVAGLSGAGTSAESLAALLRRIRRQDFWDPRPGFGLLRGGHFRQLLREVLPVQTFEDAPFPISLSAYNVLRRRTELLQGPGSLADAISASCAFPLLLQPVWLGGRPYLDGGIQDRAGFRSVRPGERVFFHHLTNAGPWRPAGAPSLEIPPHSGPRATLALRNLPKIHPFALDQGVRALALAYDAARLALRRELPPEGPLFVDVAL